MSAYSHGGCGNANANANPISSTNQGLIGMKIVSNLSCLQYQNSLSPEFRRVLGKVCDAWRQRSVLHEPSLGSASPENAARSPELWHRAPEVMQ